VAARRAAARGDFVWVDAKPGCVGPDPADGGLTIGNTFEWRRPMPVSDTIFSGNRHHPPRGEVIALVVKLSGSTANPSATEKEHYRR